MVFVGIENEIELSVGEEDASFDVEVGGLLGESLNALDEVLFDIEAAKLVNELVVVDFFVGGVLDGIGIDDHSILNRCLLVFLHFLRYLFHLL